jgi:SAM-dependent methyltransferase
LRKGWFKIDGVQDGDRTLEDQIVAVRPALTEAAGKTVLDLGCAEGLIAREFALAGASDVLGIESVAGHLEVARRICDGLAIRFLHANLSNAGQMDVGQFDIVLGLGVIHKLEFPEIGLRFAARSCKALLLLRSGRRVTGGLIHSKRDPKNVCDSHALLRADGFEMEKVVTGSARFLEDVEYWRRR